MKETYTFTEAELKKLIKMIADTSFESGRLTGRDDLDDDEEYLYEFYVSATENYEELVRTYPELEPLLKPLKKDIITVDKPEFEDEDEDEDD